MPAIARGVSRRAFIGTYGALLKSNVQGRGKSFAASVPSGSYKPQKGQKKSKEERRAMIESFVDKYKASNAEKFPSVSHTRQELGGSFYVIREIIQELQYNHRMSLSNKIEVGQPRKLEKVIDPSSVPKKKKKEPVNPAVMAFIKEVISFSRYPRVRRGVWIDKLPGQGIPSRVVMERLQDNAQFSNRDQKSDASISSIASEQVDAPSVSLKTKSEIDISQSASGQRESNTTDVNTTKLSQDMDSLNGVKQMGNHETPKTEKLHCEQLIGSEHGESSPKTASFWENLRSLRDGIINFWKKM